MTEDFFKALKIYCLTENFETLPFSGGWAEQPADLIEVINLFKVEQSRWEEEQREKEKDK